MVIIPLREFKWREIGGEAIASSMLPFSLLDRTVINGNLNKHYCLLYLQISLIIKGKTLLFIHEIYVVILFEIVFLWNKIYKL